MTIRMNCYGQNTALIPETGFVPRVPYQFKTIDNVAYCRFEKKNRTAVQRMEKVSENDMVTQTWAYGEWDDCENLEYYPINTILTVEV